ncbi:MAG: PA-phosphatase, partial [Sphingobacteriales bacterium]
ARATDYDNMAKEASLSRIVSGIHFRSDCEEGLKVGKKVGEFFIARGKTDGAQ